MGFAKERKKGGRKNDDTLKSDHSRTVYLLISVQVLPEERVNMDAKVKIRTAGEDSLIARLQKECGMIAEERKKLDATQRQEMSSKIKELQSKVST